MDKIIKHLKNKHETHAKLFEKYADEKLNNHPNVTETYNELMNEIKKHANKEEVLFEKI
jgi:predicted transcriptional regulator